MVKKKIRSKFANSSTTTTAAATTTTAAAITSATTPTTATATNIELIEAHHDDTNEFNHSDDINLSEMDHSVIGESINTGSRNVRQLLVCAANGSREMKDLLFNECNIIFECRVCRNLFRSLPNFVAHKRVYCKQHCCAKMKLFESSWFEKDKDTIGDITNSELNCQNFDIDHTKELINQSETFEMETKPIKTNPNAVFLIETTKTSAIDVEDNNTLPSKETIATKTITATQTKMNGTKQKASLDDIINRINSKRLKQNLAEENNCQGDHAEANGLDSTTASSASFECPLCSVKYHSISYQTSAVRHLRRKHGYSKTKAGNFVKSQPEPLSCDNNNQQQEEQQQQQQQSDSDCEPSDASNNISSISQPSISSISFDKQLQPLKHEQREIIPSTASMDISSVEKRHNTRGQSKRKKCFYNCNSAKCFYHVGGNSENGHNHIHVSASVAMETPKLVSNQNELEDLDESSCASHVGDELVESDKSNDSLPSAAGHKGVTIKISMGSLNIDEQSTVIDRNNSILSAKGIENKDWLDYQLPLSLNILDRINYHRQSGYYSCLECHAPGRLKQKYSMIRYTRNEVVGHVLTAHLGLPFYSCSLCDHYHTADEHWMELHLRDCHSKKYSTKYFSTQYPNPRPLTAKLNDDNIETNKHSDISNYQTSEWTISGGEANMITTNSTNRLVSKLTIKGIERSDSTKSNSEDEDSKKNSKLKLHLKPMGNSKRCYKIVER